MPVAAAVVVAAVPVAAQVDSAVSVVVPAAPVAVVVAAAAAVAVVAQAAVVAAAAGVVNIPADHENRILPERSHKRLRHFYFVRQVFVEVVTLIRWFGFCSTAPCRMLLNL
jgi:hypothetical protein